MPALARKDFDLARKGFREGLVSLTFDHIKFSSKKIDSSEKPVECHPAKTQNWLEMVQSYSRITKRDDFNFLR